MLLKYCFELTLVIETEKFDKLMDRATWTPGRTHNDAGSVDCKALKIQK